MLAGRPLAHAVMMMVPEAWEGRDDLPEHLRGFYAYHEKLMEPWDGPASITFSDGRVLGAKLDRNGLRPGRWAQTDDGWVVLASETGALPLEPARVVRRGRLKPGALWIVDLDRGALFADREVECEIAARRPYGTWAAEATIRLEDVAPGAPLPRARGAAGAPADRVRLHPRGPRHPDRPDGRDGQGADRLDGRRRRAAGAERHGAAAVLLLQAALRAGHQPGDRLAARGPGDEPDDVARARAGAAATTRRRRAAGCGCRRPVLTTDDLARVIAVAAAVGAARRHLADVAGRRGPGGRGRAAGGRGGQRASPRAPTSSCSATAASARRARRSRRCWPSRRSTTRSSARGLRTRCSLVVDSGEPREVHHVACLVGYGADAVHPLARGRRDRARAGARAC